MGIKVGNLRISEVLRRELLGDGTGQVLEICLANVSKGPLWSDTVFLLPSHRVHESVKVHIFICFGNDVYFVA